MLKLSVSALLKSFLSSTVFVRASQFPYDRTYTNGTVPADEVDSVIPDLSASWLVSSILNHEVSNPSGGLNETFLFPDREAAGQRRSLDSLQEYMASEHVRPEELSKTVWDIIPADTIEHMSTPEYAKTLFRHLNFELAPECISDKASYWYRTPDGACNWLKRGESQLGSTFQPRSRDFNQHAYADGISTPREGPNPRELSNAFFKRKKRLYYEHTPLMLGLVEWLMHDVSYSGDSLGKDPNTVNGEISFEGPHAPAEFIDVPIPAGDEAFDPQGSGNRSFRVCRSKPAVGTGTSTQNSREHQELGSSTRATQACATVETFLVIPWSRISERVVVNSRKSHL